MHAERGHLHISGPGAAAEGEKKGGGGTLGNLCWGPVSGFTPLRVPLFIARELLQAQSGRRSHHSIMACLQFAAGLEPPALVELGPYVFLVRSSASTSQPTAKNFLPPCCLLHPGAGSPGGQGNPEGRVAHPNTVRLEVLLGEHRCRLLTA